MEKLKILYEDNHIIVVQKNPNIPSQSDKTEDVFFFYLNISKKLFFLLKKQNI